MKLLHKLTLLIHSVPDDYDGVQELLSKLGESKRFWSSPLQISQ